MNRSRPSRIFLVPTLFALISIPAFGLDLPRITVDPYAQAAYGEAREYVYYNDQTLSELEWELHPALSAGVAARFAWDAGLALSADITATLPLESGIMQDSDYLNLKITGGTEKTTYSRHTAVIDYGFAASAKAAWAFELPFTCPGADRPLGIEPSAGFRYQIIKWSAHNGYCQHTALSGGAYPAWDADMDKVPAYGIGIDYQQEYWMPTAGVRISVPVSDRLDFALGFTGSLWVYCYGLDHHYIPTSGYDYTESTGYNVYLDILSGGYLVEPEFSVRWEAAPRLSVFFEGKWTIMGNLRGDTQSQYAGDDTVYVSTESSGKGGGATYSAGSVRLGVETRLR
jgi:outer membrane protease